MGMIDFFLLRHGESATNIAMKASNRGDDSLLLNPDYRYRHPSYAHLTDLGIEQARQAGAWLRDHVGPIDGHFVSPYTRTLETAAHVAPAARWQPDLRLREHDFGREAEPTTREREHPDLVWSARMRASSPFFARRVGGESMAEVVERARSFVTMLDGEADGARVLAVCHGELMRAFHVLFAHLTPQDYTDWVRSEDLADRIRNGQLFQYSRRLRPDDPGCLELAPEMIWWRSVATCDPTLYEPVWRRLERRTYNGAELLALVERTPPRVFDGR